MSNRLISQSSPYLLQHAQNPVDWYPWCKEAFEKAASEDKPVFLSIGYSTCHWCHVMAHESFENKEIAEILNKHFISIKVDREERPDIDSVYMAVCQAFTGSGGWPMSIFMTAQQKPFFAGTYFPPASRYGMTGFRDLILTIAGQWKQQHSRLLASADQILSAMQGEHRSTASAAIQNLMPKASDSGISGQEMDTRLFKQTADIFSQSFDPVHGGFGPAPKFPLPHNLLFLMLYAESFQEEAPRQQALLTLKQMRRGGIFDQIGYGFSRYSTDACFLVPHFEKMLYDNALLILAYTAAYKISGESCFLDTALQTADYIFREMTGENGEFYSAQDADSEGEEGRYYVWSYDEICGILGSEKGNAFCSRYGITKEGNFEGRNIPNLLHTDPPYEPDIFEDERKRLYEYRKTRTRLHLDDKVLTSWNALMICAMTALYRVSGQRQFLQAAEKAQSFIDKHLRTGSTLYVSCRGNTRSSCGFLDDYACETMALLSLYAATGTPVYLEHAQAVCREAISQFADKAGGYFLYGTKNDPLITKPKECYDGALPSGNSVMAFCLVRLSQLTTDDTFRQEAEKQLAFLAQEAARYPAGYSMYLTALLFYRNPPRKITVLLSKADTDRQILPQLPLFADVTMLEHETEAYRLIDGRTTYYVCQQHTCLPPVNQLPASCCRQLI